MAGAGLREFCMQPSVDRYHWMLQQDPELFQRVPPRYIASYLGITGGMLSTIKTTEARTKQK